MNIQFITEKAIQQNISMLQAIDLMKTAFKALSSGKAIVPIRTNMPMKDANSLIMPVYLENEMVYGVKIVSINHKNASKGLPLIHAVFQLFNTENGFPLAVFDAEYLTALRTGAASGLATKLLSNPKANTLAIFGAGTQSIYQIEAICCVRPITQIYVFSRNEVSGNTFVKYLSEKYTINISWESDHTILSQCDIICTATSSKTPVFSNLNLKPSVHINGIGSYQADMAEIPPEVVKNSRIIVDQKEACLNEAGDIIQPLQNGLITEPDIHSELGELVNSNKINLLQKEMTFFKSVGNAVQDLVVANDVWNKVKGTKS